MVKKHFTITLFFVLTISFLKTAAQVSVIPKPNEITYTEGKFNYTKGLDIKVVRGDDATKRLQKQLTDFVKDKKITFVPFSNTFISLNLLQANTSNIPPEAYTLTITPGSAAITASSNAGLFYGIQSLMQIISADTVKMLSCIEIKDNPAYSYRGLHIDEVHQFFGAEVIKQYLDAMAKLKLNQFHWQLADEEKWRFSLKSDSTLTVNENFYTQKEIKDILAYAQERFINIIPEIILPFATEDLYAQNNKNIIDEVSLLFPGRLIHTGNSLMDTATSRYLSSKNKKTIGPDNTIFDSDILLSYKSSKSGWSAAEKGTDVIMAPRQYCSLDYYQDWDDEKKSFSMMYLPLDKVYAFKPSGKIKDSKTLEHILGGQACVPTTFIKNAGDLQYQVFPRLVAFAECVWTKSSKKNFSDFSKRMKNQKNYFFKEKEMPKIDMVRFKPTK